MFLVRVKGFIPFYYIMQTDIKQQLLTEKPTKLLFSLSIPAIIGMLVIGLYSLMDGIFAGNIMWQVAMTACSVAFPLTLLNNGVAVLLWVGSASVLSRAIWKWDQKKIDWIMWNLIFWVIVFSLIITVGGIIFAPHFLSMVGATWEILELWVRYLRVLLLGSLFVNFMQSANMVMRGEWLMKKAVLIMWWWAILNIILDPIFMYAMWEYAIEWAAIATIISQIVPAAITLHYFLKKSKTVKIHKIAPNKDIYPEVFSVWISAMLMQVLAMVAQSLLYKMAFKYWWDADWTLMAVALRVYVFSFIPLRWMSQWLQPIIWTNFWAKKYDRVKQTMKVFFVWWTVLAALIWIPMLVFPGSILSLFWTEAEIIQMWVNNLRICYSAFILYGIMIMIITYFQSIWNGKIAGIMVILRQLVLFVPAVVILPMIFGKIAVWFGLPLVDFIVTVMWLRLFVKSIKKLDNREQFQN